MRRMPSCAAAIAFFALVFLPPGDASALSLCLVDDPSAPLYVPSAEKDSLSPAKLVEAPGAMGGESEHLSFSGSASYVYGSYSGCGERTQFSIGNALKLSYSTASGRDPFERLAGETRDDESFFDAEYKSAIGGLGEMGYAASLYTATGADHTRDRVTGSRVWFSSADNRIRLSSQMAVSASAAKDRIGTAQRHQISLVMIDSASSNLSTSLAFSSVDRSFEARRSLARSDRQVLDAAANLRTGKAALSLTFRSAQDNLDDDRDRATHFWRTVKAEGSYQLGQGLLPERIKVYANRTEWQQVAWNLDDLMEENDAVGLAMTWTDWLDRDVTEGPGAIAVSADLFTDWRGLGGPDDEDGTATGANTRLSIDLGRLFAIPGHVGTGARIVGGETLDDGFGWRWDLSAEIDCLDLLFDSPSSRSAYLLGRFGSGISEWSAGLNIGYRGMLAAGIRF